MIHELRHYDAVPSKKDALMERFFNGTFALFAQHGFRLIQFWDQPDSNELWYILAWPNREDMARGWNNFKNDDGWKALKASSEADGPLIENIRSVVLLPRSPSAPDDIGG
ncbi:NIPSNAP family protein [Aestuariivirga sp.]|uniref:NIPSNAP family protein n=1 Tax=Aestuariivirga sp. TaxID=2650926 RepID=UPI003BAB67ED